MRVGVADIVVLRCRQHAEIQQKAALLTRILCDPTDRLSDSSRETRAGPPKDQRSDSVAEQR
jgi:hypothetical protein